VAAWRGTRGAIKAARAGHDVIMCSNDALYLDYRQSDDPGEPVPTRRAITLRDVYEFNPVPPSLDSNEAAHIIGVQGSIWSEFIDNPRALDYLAFPRLCAVAEVAWGPARRDFADFSRRLAAHLPRLASLGVEYRRAGRPLPWQTRPGVPGRNASIPAP
jgi:hexosaminidase